MLEKKSICALIWYFNFKPLHKISKFIFGSFIGKRILSKYLSVINLGFYYQTHLSHRTASFKGLKKHFFVGVELTLIYAVSVAPIRILLLNKPPALAGNSLIFLSPQLKYYLTRNSENQIIDSKYYGAVFHFAFMLSFCLALQTQRTHFLRRGVISPLPAKLSVPHDSNRRLKEKTKNV